jgi:hypothetical protein
MINIIRYRHVYNASSHKFPHAISDGSIDLVMKPKVARNSHDSHDFLFQELS